MKRFAVPGHSARQERRAASQVGIERRFHTPVVRQIERPPGGVVERGTAERASSPLANFQSWVKSTLCAFPVGNASAAVCSAAAFGSWQNVAFGKVSKGNQNRQRKHYRFIHFLAGISHTDVAQQGIERRTQLLGRWASDIISVRTYGGYSSVG